MNTSPEFDYSFSTEDLRHWQNDEKGKPFWDALRKRFSDGISNMRREVRKGDMKEAVYHAAQVDAAEEILQLVDALIDEKKSEETEI